MADASPLISPPRHTSRIAKQRGICDVNSTSPRAARNDFSFATSIAFMSAFVCLSDSM